MKLIFETDLLRRIMEDVEVEREEKSKIRFTSTMVVSQRESKEQTGPTNIRTELTGQNVESPNQYEVN